MGILVGRCTCRKGATNSADSSLDPINSENLSGAGLAVKVHARAIPMVVKMTALNQIAHKIGVEEPCALSAGIAHTRVDETIRLRGAQSLTKRLGLNVAVGVEGGQHCGLIPAQVVQRRTEIHNQL